LTANTNYITYMIATSASESISTPSINVSTFFNTIVAAYQSKVYTQNGTSWSNITLNSNEVFDMFYNGTIWAAIGRGGNIFSYSYNGITWSAGSASFAFSAGYAIYSNGSKWVGVGDYYPNAMVYWSNDGISWNITTNRPNIGGQWVSVTYSKTKNLWMAGGNGGYTTSSDGENWSTISGSGYNLITDNIDVTYTVAYGNNMWIMGGRASNLNATKSTMFYSFDAYNWITNPSGSFMRCIKAITYNGFMWVAGSAKIQSYDPVIGWSNDGITWTLGNINDANTYSVNRIIWTGSIWMAATQAQAYPISQSVLKTSTDGKNWTAVNELYNTHPTITDIRALAIQQYISSYAGAPILLSTGVRSISSISLTWAGAEGASSLTFTYGTSSITTSASQTKPYTISSLIANTVYTTYITANSPSGILSSASISISTFT
jgi:hypothetical protein